MYTELVSRCECDVICPQNLKKMKKKRDSKKKEQNGTRFFDPMAVTWTEKYDKQISKVWNVIPDKVAKIIATIAVFLLGISINGNVFIVIFCF